MPPEPRRADHLLLRAARGEAVERDPVWAMRQAGRWDPEFNRLRAGLSFYEFSENVELAARASLLPRRFGVDAIILFYDITTLPVAMGQPFVLKPALGPVPDHPVRTLDDVDQLAAQPDPESYRHIRDLLHLVRAELNGDLPVLVFAGAPFTTATYCINTGKDMAATRRFAAEEPRMVSKVLGLLRLHLGRELGLIDESRWEFLWVTDMPLLRWEEDDQRWMAEHHPFTRPNDEGLALLETDPGAARAVAYDLVGNGIELAGGSFRIHEPKLQSTIFDFLGISPEEQRSRFGFLLDALAMGAPPHGGIASGIDRLMMALLAEPAIRDTQAFPKNQVGVDPMTGAPTTVSADQLAELGLDVVAEVQD